MIAAFRSAVHVLLVLRSVLPSQDLPIPAELAGKPPYERLLRGADLAKAEALDARYSESMSARKFAEARKIAEEIVALRTRLQGADHWEVTDAISKRDDAELYGKFPEQVIAELEKAGQLDLQTEELYRQGHFAAAARLGEKVVASRKRILGEGHPAYATSLNNLAVLRTETAEFSKAEPLLIEARDLRSKTLGEHHPDYATSINNFAMMYLAMNDHARAEPLFLKTLELERKVQGEKSSGFARSLNNLAESYRVKGDFAKAEPLMLQVLELDRQLQGENHPNYASSLNNIAGLYQSIGDFAKAEPLMLQVVELDRKLQGENHPSYASGLNNLAVLYESQGEFEKAEAMYIQSMQLRKSIHGDRHPSYATSLNNLAMLYSRQHEYAKAEPLIVKAQAVDREIHGENHPNYASSLNNLAELYRKLGKTEEAEQLYLQARDIWKKHSGENHPNYAASLSNLAALYVTLGKFSDAETLYRQSRELRRKIFGENHPIYAITSKSIALLHIEKNEYSKSEHVLLDCTRSFEMSRLSRARGFRRAIGGEGENPYFPLAVVSARLGKPRQGFEAMEMNLARALLDVQAERRGQRISPAMQERKDTILNKLRPIEQRVNVLIARPQAIDEEKLELDRLIETRRKLNIELADLAAELSRQEVSDFETIRNAIPAGHALLAWIDVTANDGKTDEHWACIVKSAGDPAWVQLQGSGEKGRWTDDERRLTNRLRTELDQDKPNLETIDTLFEKIRAQRVKPLEQHLEGIETLYVVPVENMAGIPVEPMLPDRKICYVPSGTFLARRGQPADRPDTILAVGDPVFPARSEPGLKTKGLPPGGLLLTRVDPEGSAARAKLKAGDVLVSYAGTKLDSVERLGQSIAANGGDRQLSVEIWRAADEKVSNVFVAPGDLGVEIAPQPAREAITAGRQNEAILAAVTRDESWSELPGTNVEVVKLKSLFGDTGCRYLTRSEASEQNLDAMRKADALTDFEYLHLATHGLADNVVAFNSRIILSQDRPKADEAAAGEPLLDNQLMAKEVMDHWHLNASLVTLSACESGLGRKGGGDGLLGFAQSFLLAGSRSVCLSLWKVNDAATALLMERFYRNLIEMKMTKVAALKEAKDWLKNLSMAEATERMASLDDLATRGSRPGRENIEAPRSKASNETPGPFANPKYWAGFVLIGSPD